MTVPTYLPYVVLTGNALTLIAILYGLNRALADAAWPTQERRRALALSAAILLGWLAVALGLSGAGFYHVTADGIPTIQYGLLLPILIGVLLDLAVEARPSHPRRRAATVARRRAVLPRARRGVPHPLCRRPLAGPVRLAGRRRRHRHRSFRTVRRPRLCAGPAREGGRRQGVERARHPRSRRRRDDWASSPHRL